MTESCDAAVDDAAGGITKARLELFQKHVPGKLRSVTVVRLPEDKFFAESIASVLFSNRDDADWCRGMAVDPQLIAAAGSVLDVSRVPVIEPRIYVIVPDLNEDGTQLVMKADDRDRLLVAGVSLARVDEVAAAFGKRSTPNNRTASIVVHVPAVDALPVVEIPEARVVLAAFAIPIDNYRDDVLFQGMSSFVHSMLKQLDAVERPAKAAYYSYFWQPWSLEAQNVKIFALRYITAAEVTARNLPTQLMAQRRLQRTLAVEKNETSTVSSASSSSH